MKNGDILVKNQTEGIKAVHNNSMNSVFAYFYFSFIYYVDKACFAVRNVVCA